MSYNTTDEFQNFSYPSGSYSDIPTAVVVEYLQNAYDEINNALGVRWEPPLSGSGTSQLKQIERVIASFRLRLWAGIQPDPNNTIDNILVGEYQNIIAEGGVLDQIKKGQILFPTGSDQTPNTKELRNRVWGNPKRDIRMYNSDGKEVIF